jgi:hypothetical protein
MAENWPDNLPDSPLLDGYAAQRKDTLLRSSVDAGLDKIRNRYRAAPKFKTERFYFTNPQKLIFEDFHENILGGGAERFIRLNPETGLNSEYRFRSEPDYSLNGVDHNGPTWVVSLSLEVLPS